MGTSGLMGVRVDGVDKLTYNHFDSYPSGLGEDIVTDIRKMLSEIGLNKMRALAASMKLVDERAVPSAEAMKDFAGSTDNSVGDGNSSWYNLTRDLQGKLYPTLQAGVMCKANDFIFDSLFCEWAYIINFDDGTLEIYKGFQRNPHVNGRYSSMKPTGRGMGEYFPCALVLTLPLDDIPNNWRERLPGESD